MARMVNLQDLLMLFSLLYLISFYSQKKQYMSTDTLKPLINLRNKGMKTAMGKLHKGCVKDAFTKLSIGSIPSNYESIIYHHQQKKGFGTGQKRFFENRSQMIKPQIYENNQIDEPATRQKKKYFSSQGSRSSSNKEKSDWVIIVQTPQLCKYLGKKQYKNTSNDKKRRTRKCFTRQRQDYKRKQLILNKENEQLPGPGFYDVNNDHNHALAGWKSSFVTKVPRDTYIPKIRTPGPGYYIEQNHIKEETLQTREKPDEQYYKILVKQKKAIPKHYIEKRKRLEIPGPGSYHAELPSFKPIYEKIKISHNFIQNSRDRFNDPQQKAQQIKQWPTPLDYDIVSSFDKIEKKMIHMPCFMSQSKREPFKGSGLGPSLAYDVTKPIDTNFHFNIRGKWV